MLHRQPWQESKALETTALEESEGTSGKQHIAEIFAAQIQSRGVIY